MLALNLPKFEIKIKQNNAKLAIFDILRRRYITLTPEEWVRQHFINFLITYKHYPAPLMGNEISLTLNSTKKRCDSVVYSRNGAPLMIIEYKAPEIEITQKAFDQISRYNLVMHVDYLMISNGMRHFCCKMNYEQQTYHFLEDIPNFEQL